MGCRVFSAACSSGPSRPQHNKQRAELQLHYERSRDSRQYHKRSAQQHRGLLLLLQVATGCGPVQDHVNYHQTIHQAVAQGLQVGGG